LHQLSNKKIPLHNQCFDFGLPNEHEENDDALCAVKDVENMKNETISNCPRNELYYPRNSHDGKKAEI